MKFLPVLLVIAFLVSPTAAALAEAPAAKICGPTNRPDVSGSADTEEGEAGDTEDKIPYSVDHDAPLDAEEVVDTKTDAYTRYRVEFNGIKGDRVPAYLYIPRGKKGPHPAVLLQYGSGGNKNTNYIVALGEQFVEKGFVVLTIDAPFKGERKPRNARTWRSFFGDSGRFQWYLGDYSRAVDYLVQRKEVDPQRIGYAGISWGAITGITFVAHDPRIKAMASIVGGGNFLGTLKVDVPDDTKRAAQRIDPIYHVQKIAPRPLLLLNVTKDQLVPRFFSDALHKAAGDPKTTKKVWLETDHFFNGVDRYAVLAEVIEFMEEGLEQSGE